MTGLPRRFVSADARRVTSETARVESANQPANSTLCRTAGLMGHGLRIASQRFADATRAAFERFVWQAGLQAGASVC